MKVNNVSERQEEGNREGQRVNDVGWAGLGEGCLDRTPQSTIATAATTGLDRRANNLVQMSRPPNWPTLNSHVCFFD